MPRIIRRLLYLTRQRQMDADLAEELSFHQAMKQAELERAGIPTDDAGFASRRALGNGTLAREHARAVWIWRWLDDLSRDVVYAVRGLRRNPGFTAVAILTLALGIGANTAIFSVVNAVLLRPLPYKDSDRLVQILQHIPAAETSNAAPRRIPVIDGASFSKLRSQSQTLSDVAGSVFATMTLTGRDEAVRMDGSQMTASAFSMLGVPPLLGRAFESREESSGADAVVVLSYLAWQRLFSGDSDVVGRLVTLDGRGRAVVGVMPRGFQFPDAQAQFWIPYVMPTVDARRGISPAVVARLKDGVLKQEAEAEINTILRQERVSTTWYELAVVQDELVAPVKPALRLLAVAVGLVLLIACVNVANLLLARTAARQREIAIRFALGAGRGRLIRQTLSESVLLSVVGGAVGAALAFGGIRLLQVLGASLARRDLGPGVNIPRLDEIGIDGTVLAFTVTVSVLTGLFFGMAPAIGHSRLFQTNVLREGASSSARTRGLLVVLEMAMAMILLVGGGLLMHSFIKLSHVDPGYDPTHVLTFQVTPRRAPRELRTFAEELVGRLQSLPDVRAAGYGNNVPLIQLGFARDVSATPLVPGQPLPRPFPGMHAVSRDFVKTFGMRVIEGRGFAADDSARREALINRTLARSGFLGERPIGKRIYSFGNTSWEVVGIVEDVRQWGLDRKADMDMYVVDFVPPPPGLGGIYFAVRTAGEPTAPARSIRDLVRQLEPEATVDNVATMEQLVSNSVSRPRLYAVLLGIFAGVAVALAAIGLYGVMAYSVAQRTREIGVRMALGAQRAEVMGLVLRQSVPLIAVGIVLGLIGAAGFTRYLEGMLFGLTPLDPSTFIAVAVLFALVAMLAAFVPSRRAAKVDPMVALRCE